MTSPVPVFSILDYKGIGGYPRADPTGRDSSAPALQWAIDMALLPRDPGVYGAGAVVYIPPGIWRIGKISKYPDFRPAIRIKARDEPRLTSSGLAIVGAGCYSGPIDRDHDPRDWIDMGGVPPSAGPVTVLIWDGGSDDDEREGERKDYKFPSSLFWVSRAMGLTIADMTLIGCSERFDEPKRERARRLILFEQPKGGASNRHTLRNLHLADAMTGVQFGGDTTDSNCADALLERVLWSYLEDGMIVLHQQGVNYRVRMLHARDCKTGFNFQGGGCLDAQGVVFERCATDDPPVGEASKQWCIRLGQIEGDDLLNPQILAGNLVFTAKDVRFTGGTRRFLFADLGAQVNARGWHEAQKSQGPSEWKQEVHLEPIHIGRASVVLEAGIFATKPLVRFADPVDVEYDSGKNSHANIVFRDDLFLEQKSGSEFPLAQSGTSKEIAWTVYTRKMPVHVVMERCDVIGNRAALDR